MPDSPPRDGRKRRFGLIVVVAVVAITVFVGGRIILRNTDFDPPGGGGSAKFEINDSTTEVSQSGSIDASFPGTPLTYSGPLGCEGRYFTGTYTQTIKFFFRYADEGAYMLFNNVNSPVYRFGPPQHRGESLVFSNPQPADRRLTVTVDCPA